MARRFDFYRRLVLGHWPLIMAVAFSLLTSALLLSLHSSQSHLRDATDAYLIADNKRRAETLSDFLVQRRQAVKTLAASHEVENYLLNRALGMSLKYGLNVNLDAIGQSFQYEIDQHTLRGQAVYKAIVFLGENGETLASAGKQESGVRLTEFSKDHPHLSMDTARMELLASFPVVFKGAFSGVIVTISDLRLISSLLLSGGEGGDHGYSRHQEFLLTDTGINISPGYQLSSLSPAVGRSLAELPENTPIPAQYLLGEAQFKDRLIIRCAVDGLPLSMLTLISAKDVYGELTSPAYVLYLGTFAVALLLSAVGFERSRKRADQLQSEVNQLAFYDPLTGLPNRRLFIDRLKQAIATRHRYNRQRALLFIDLDNFKSINDTLGHHTGDLLLQQVAQRLTSNVRKSDTVARLGGDEFVILLEEQDGEAQETFAAAKVVGNKVLNALNQSYLLAGHSHQTTASIGITVFSDHHRSAEKLLQEADLAMYQAKAAGRNGVRFFDPEMQTTANERAILEAGLREAILQRQFLLHYQVQVDASGRAIGAEVLLRWQSAEHGLIFPNQFIPLAEETRLIIPLGQWVIETACAQLAVWAKDPELAHLVIAVNVSAHQFHHKDFVSQVVDALEQSGANAHRLKIELTESVLVKNVDAVIAKMSVLKAKGVGFSLDDFGTGYSSLSHLKCLPLDQLKIDCSFVRDILADANDAAIAKMIVALGKSLGLVVVAEGVEEAGQKELLVRDGCHAFQGYYFSRPVPLADFEAKVKQIGGQSQAARAGAAMPQTFENELQRFAQSVVG